MKQNPLNQKSNYKKVVAIKNPTHKIYHLFTSISILLLLSLLLPSCSNKKKEATKSDTERILETLQTVNEAVASTENYKIVPNDKVCMVNDRFMGGMQIPIEAYGTVYYGCCENCIEKLQKNLNDVRLGSNPLNDKKVGKA